MDFIVKLVALLWCSRLGRFLPGFVLDWALMRLLPPTYSQKKRTRRWVPPSFFLEKGTPFISRRVGRSVQCHGYSTQESEVFLPRMIRTKEGREVLQHQLIKERQNASPTLAG